MSLHPTVKESHSPLKDGRRSRNVELLAMLRGESVEEVERRFGTSLKSAPRSFSEHIPAMRGVKFLDVGMDGEFPYVVLENKRVFYGFRSQRNHERMFHFFSDQLDPKITPETFLVALDVVHRYITDFAWPPAAILPPQGGVIVEAGAYLGHKTIRFADELVGPEGAVLAIEMMPENVDILKKNVAANNLESVITVEQAGVWNESGNSTVTGKGRQRFSLIELEKLANGQSQQVLVDTLDRILARWGRFPVDLMFISVNGAEIEAIEGLNEVVKQVKGLYIAAPYERGGESTVVAMRPLLEPKGYQLLELQNPVRVIAKLS